MWRDADLTAAITDQSRHVLHHNQLAVQIDVISDELFTPLADCANIAFHCSFLFRKSIHWLGSGWYKVITLRGFLPGAVQ